MFTSPHFTFSAFIHIFRWAIASPSIDPVTYPVLWTYFNIPKTLTGDVLSKASSVFVSTANFVQKYYLIVTQYSKLSRWASVLLTQYSGHYPGCSITRHWDVNAVTASCHFHLRTHDEADDEDDDEADDEADDDDDANHEDDADNEDEWYVEDDADNKSQKSKNWKEE